MKIGKIGGEKKKTGKGKFSVSSLTGMDRKKLFIGLGVFLVFLIMISGGGGKKETKKEAVTKALQSQYQMLSTNMAVLNKKLDKRITNLENFMKKQKELNGDLETQLQRIKNIQGQMTAALARIQKSLDLMSDRIANLEAKVQIIQQAKNSQPFKNVKPKAPTETRLTAITIKGSGTSAQPAKKKPKPPELFVKLPDASVARGTIVSGAYAPVTSRKWLPTIINIDGNFYGPNHTRVPLEDCKVLAKAQGDYTTQRAYMKIYELSCVLPDGTARSFKVDGYVSSRRDSAYGVQGELVSVTGRYIAGSFLGSVISAVAGSFARSQVTQTVTSSGAAVSSVTGNPVEYSLMNGASAGVNKIVSYYQGKLDKLIDMIYVPSGTKVWVVIQKGAVIKGLKPTFYSAPFAGVD